jgi:hypothetical protein
MNFDIGGFIINQYVLLFAAAVLGLAFGKIKIGKFAFGLSGTLFSGLLLGWAAVAYAGSVPKTSPIYAAASKVEAGNVISNDFFNLFLIIFIAAIGLLTGKDIGKALKKYGIKWCPLVEKDFILPDTVNEMLDYSTGKSALYDTLREGVVFRNYSKGISFKAVSPDFLIKHGE